MKIGIELNPFVSRVKLRGGSSRTVYTVFAIALTLRKVLKELKWNIITFI